MSVIVTGGAGFIGANFIFHLMRTRPDERIVCVDALTYAGCLQTIAPLLNRPLFRFVRADICDRDEMNRLFEEERPDAVINFAAESHVDRSIEHPDVFLRTNIMGTQVLLDACMKHGVRRFHQVSTDEVYGDLPDDRPDLLFTEDSPIRPSSPYSASKASADHLVLAWHRTYGLPATVSRCSNNYGPYQFPEKLIPWMISRAVSGQSLPVFGDGRNIRDWLHVEDHCRAIERIVYAGRPGEVYNIGGRNEIRNIDLVKRLCSYLGVSEEKIEFVADRKGHDLRYAIDASKMKRELGWESEVDFEEGLARTVQWYLTHRMWWEKIVTGAYRLENERLLAGEE